MFKIITIVLMLTNVTAFAKNVFVGEVQGMDVRSGEAYSIRELIKSAVNQSEGNSVVSDKSSADLSLSPMLLVLNENYILKLDQVVNGKTVRSLKMKSIKLNDIDRVTERLVKAHLEGSAISQTADVTNITQEEQTKNTTRIEVTRQWIFGFGPSWMPSSGTSKSGFYYKLGYIWGLDSQFSLKLAFDGTSIQDSSASFSMFRLGVDYHLNQMKTSPYVGISVGRGSADTHGCDVFIFDNCDPEQSASGWAIATNAGYKFFRTSAVNLGLELQHAFIFDKHSEGTPQRLTLSINAYY